MRKNVFVSSTSSVVNGPPYFSFPRSIRGAIILFSCKAVSYLFYPLLGWMADLCFALLRYKFVLFFFIALIPGKHSIAIATSAVTLGFPQDHSLMYYPAALVIVIVSYCNRFV